ncbi:MAG: M24 family metallopeptidase [Armatimonadota bacterium]|nr:M24 family metallopeptidase [Armatimonadota bacterium]MDR7390480.1 M24 family metallopeptidase [Armatimonadota bacterium]MDR7394006.1 M24 family metallopeptidase [Armatimonadota bacterium]MDR7395799.1 M24 family metallopeptidase [Armatimonadota bacterium]MDR7398431.1 M24 family metallopeptidase [Armatimonadota bacterium]
MGSSWRAVWAEDGYPLFSDDEVRRRRAQLAQLVERSGVDRLVLYGNAGSGDAVQWFTGWPVTREAAVVWAPGEAVKLFVQYRNHVPTAQRAVASDVQVVWAGPATARTVAEELVRRGGEQQRVGVVGPLPGSAWHPLATRVRQVVDLTPSYVSLRLVKSEEELAWLRAGAELTDRAVRALEAALRPGVSEFELVDVVERAYVPLGGSTHIHFLSVTSMTDPDRCVPAQYPSGRRVRVGDVVVCEISAAFWGYAGQLLRTFVVGAEPTPLFRELHRVAEEAFEHALRVLRPGIRAGELLRVLEGIRRAGFTVYDDLVHGYGGGYLPPVLGPEGFDNPQDAELILRPGMALVIQPNVVTPDARAGVQTGELVVLREDGVEPVHGYPRGLRRVG